MSTAEHITHFTVQYGNLGANEVQKLRLFPNSLTGSAFSWYITLRPTSVQSWREMEDHFHAQFYRTEPMVFVADLAKMCQFLDESVEKFVSRFKIARYKCLTMLSENEFTKMALGGLHFEVRKRFAGQKFTDLGQLVAQATSYELLLREEEDLKSSSLGIYYKPPAPTIMGSRAPKVADFADYEDCDEDYEISITEIISGKPYVCKALAQMAEQSGSAPAKTFRDRDAKNKYTYDTTKAELVFDHVGRTVG
ncbi:uncharacterized protein LOC122644944 [Telopea speciosissima]|uniref:uncharacterized protein LOC122644944 n=1 Tax=Telopea speciosissima TaxID=54955 RepID=UPI001CC414DF|nr:uncharacterized protein LOC122644944 [Telopea speciosissima]